MKKIINQPELIIQEMLAGFAQAHEQDVTLLQEEKIVVRKGTDTRKKVGLVSGGGSGHEPAHAGYVGEGMLDAAVAGEIFTSPTPDQILTAIKAVDSGQGVLLIVKNYTGDVLNFDMAKDLAEAEGIEVEQVVVHDDVATEDSTFTTGRRGVAGTVLVHKIAGAMASLGASLQEVKAVAEKVIHNVGTLGVSLSPCINPLNGEASFTLGDIEMEIGVGIHGEPGIKRGEIKSADVIATELTETVLADLGLVKGDEVAVMVNGLGGTPQMELYIVNRKVKELLNEKEIHVYDTFVGDYMTSLEMAGCSLTLLKLDDELKKGLDEKSAAPAFLHEKRV